MLAGLFLLGSPFSLSAQAAGVEVTGATYTTDAVQITKYSVDEGVTEIENGAEYRVVTAVAYGSQYVSITWPQQDPLQFNVFRTLFEGYLVQTSPSVTNWNLRHTEVIIDNVTVPGLNVSHAVEPYLFTNGRGWFRCWGEENNAYAQTCQFCISFHVVSTYVSANTLANAGDITLYSPTIALQNTGVHVYGISPASQDPLLYDANYGWLPIMADYLGSIDTQMMGVNTNLGTQTGLLGSINTHVVNIDNFLQQQASAGADIASANESFADVANDFESDQAVIEVAADSAFDAVDMDVSLLGTYSQSMTFWMRCVNALPTIAGAFWEALVFGFLIAFLIFILKLVR